MGKPWLKFYDPPVPQTIAYPEFLLPQILDEAAEHFPDQTAVFFFGGRVKYDQLRAQANRFASALRETGFRKGDRLGLLLANMPQTIISSFGALKAGGIVVFFDPLAEEEELQRQLNEAGVEILVVLDLVLPRVDRIFSKTKLKQFIITGVKDYLPFPRDIFFNLAARGRGMNVKVARKPHIRLFKEFLLSGRSDLPPAEGGPGNPEEVAVMQYTSGTSGPPKGVLLTHQNLTANVLQASAWVGNLAKGEETFLSILPFHRAYGMTLGMNLPIHLAAMSIHLPDTEAKIVDPASGEKEMGVGEPGELIVKGPQVMKGYWNRPEETKRRFARAGCIQVMWPGWMKMDISTSWANSRSLKKKLTRAHPEIPSPLAGEGRGEGDENRKS